MVIYLVCTCSGEQIEKAAKTTFVFYSPRVLPPVPEILLVLQLSTVVSRVKNSICESMKSINQNMQKIVALTW